MIYVSRETNYDDGVLCPSPTTGAYQSDQNGSDREMNGRQRRPVGSVDAAVSPVVGVVLIVAITIASAVVVSPLVLGLGEGVADSPPEASFAFSYDEGAGESETDSYGNTAGDIGADGKLTIILENGGPLDVEQLRVRSGPSGGPLEDTAVYSQGDEWSDAETISVWVERGDRVIIAWEHTDSNETAVIEQFLVIDPDEVDPWTPWPESTHDCEYVDDQNSSGSDLTITAGQVVDCDVGSEYGFNTVDIDGGVLIGQAFASDDITVDSAETYEGSLTTNTNDIDVSDSEINGDVAAGNSTQIVNSTVDGDVEATDTVDVDDSSTGSIESNGDVDVANSTVQGDLVSGKTADLDGSSTIIEGDVEADTVDMGDQTEITGDVEASSVICGDNTSINGISCEEYVAPEYRVSIDNTNSPIEEGETLSVNATVTNVGINSGDQNIRLHIDGELNDTESSVQLSGGASTSLSVDWSNAGPAAEYDANVSSEDDFERKAVTVSSSPLAELDVHAFTVPNKTTEESFDQEITVEETDGTVTQNATMTLSVTAPDGTTVYEQTVDSTDTNELKGNTTTIVYGTNYSTDELGPFGANEEDYVAVANATADNAGSVERTETFNVDVSSQAENITRVNGSAGVQGQDRPFFKFEVTGEVDLQASALNTTGSLAGVGASSKNKKSFFDVSSATSDTASDSDGNFAYDFSPAESYQDGDGTFYVEFDKLDAKINDISFVNNRTSADLIVGFELADDQTYFYFEEV